MHHVGCTQCTQYSGWVRPVKRKRVARTAHFSSLVAPALLQGADLLRNVTRPASFFYAPVFWPPVAKLDQTIDPDVQSAYSPAEPASPLTAAAPAPVLVSDLEAAAMPPASLSSGSSGSASEEAAAGAAAIEADEQRRRAAAAVSGAVQIAFHWEERMLMPLPKGASFAVVLTAVSEANIDCALCCAAVFSSTHQPAHLLLRVSQLGRS